MNSITVGDVEVVALTDIEGAFFGLDQIFPGVRQDQWEPYVARYPWAFADRDTLYGRVGAYLLRSPGGTVLVDAGVGPGPSEDPDGSCKISRPTASRPRTWTPCS